MKDLAELIKNGDEHAFEVYFKAEFGNIVYFAKQYVNDSGVATDIAQESFISLWENHEKIESAIHLRRYLFTIAKNKALNVLKSNPFKLHHTYSREITANVIALSKNTIDNQFDELTLQKLISKVYKNLPEGAKESFILNREYGLSYTEIAELKGMSVKKVEYRIKTALKYFKENLKDYLLLFF